MLQAQFQYVQVVMHNAQRIIRFVDNFPQPSIFAGAKRFNHVYLTFTCLRSLGAQGNPRDAIGQFFSIQLSQNSSISLVFAAHQQHQGDFQTVYRHRQRFLSTQHSQQLPVYQGKIRTISNLVRGPISAGGRNSAGHIGPIDGELIAAQQVQWTIAFRLVHDQRRLIEKRSADALVYIRQILPVLTTGQSTGCTMQLLTQPDTVGPIDITASV